MTFALSAVLASQWAHEITVHGATLPTFALPAAAFAILWTSLTFLPMLAIAPALIRVRIRAIPAYSMLVGDLGRLLHRRWMLHEPIAGASILDAPEIGQVAEANSMYETVERMRFLPIGKAALAMVLIPIGLPMIAVVALQVPVMELLLKVVRGLL